MINDTIYEFRNYELRPGQRDVLIDLFEREFIEPQEALGAHIRATFRDLDDPNRFIWMRSFADGPARFAALDGFYGGPVWQTHRNTANATIVDSDNVMQLRPVSGGLESTAPDGRTAETIVSTAYFLAPHVENDFIARFARDVVPELGGTAPFATFVTDQTPNIYPRLPVRTNETVFLTFARASISEGSADAAHAEEALKAMLIALTERRRLQPTSRSPLR